MLSRKMMVVLMSGMFILSEAAYGTTYYVATDGVDDPNYGLDPCTPFATIQYGINATSNGDVVNVSEGTYYENIYFDGKGITVTSSNPSDWDIVAATIIDACDVGNVVELGEDADSVIAGFTVQNSGTSGYGIYCNSSSPLISCCIIKDNNRGIQISGSYCVPAVYDNRIYNNTFGILAATYTEPVIKNNWIYDNAYGVRFYISGPAIFRNNTIVGNTGYGVSKTSTATPIISNCILWNNGYDLDNCTATYSCIEDGDAGTGNISSYPYFADYANDDFHLTWNSPCINRGDPCVNGEGETDIDGESRVADGRVDMGADEMEFYLDPCNLVKNPGFEMEGGGKSASSNDPCVPLYWWDYWQGTPSSASSKVIDGDVWHSGTEGHSWRFELEEGGNYVGARSQDYFTIKAGTLYQLSCWLKSSAGTEDASFRVVERDSEENVIKYDSNILNSTPTNWGKYYKHFLSSEEAEYAEIWLIGPEDSAYGTVWWDDICLQEFYPHEEYAPAYGCIKNTSGVISIDFGSGDPCESLVQGTITDYMSAPANDDSDPCNVNYRSLLKGEMLTLEFTAFNVDENGFPLSPMLIEIMYKDNISNAKNVTVRSKIDYIDLDPNYITESKYSPDPCDRDIRLAYLGGRNDNEWKYMQYAFQKNDFQLLRAIGGVFVIKINNPYNSNIPIDYISLRTISDEEYESWCEVQRSSKGFYEAKLPEDSPENPNYDDPCMVIFARDIMRPVYRHTKPDPCEVDQDVEGFGTWGEVEPLSFSIYSLNGISDLSFTVSDLEHETEDACIPADNISLYQVVYAQRRLGYDELRTFALVPDRLEEFTTLSIDPNSSKRIWLKLQVPYEDENLPAGLYEGNVTIKKNGVTQNTVKVKFTIYDITLAWPDCINAVYLDPFSDVYSSDLGKVCQAYREAGFDMFIASRSHRITATGTDACDITFDTTNFKASLDRMIDEGLVGDKVVVGIPSALQNEVFDIIYGIDYMPTEPNLYGKLSDPCFSQAFGALIDAYREIGNSYDPCVVFIFEIIDEPGNDFGGTTQGYRRILTDRLGKIIHAHGGKTYAAYSSYCDVILEPAAQYNVSHTDNTYDPNLGPLTDVIDYKAWNRKNIGLGYEEHSDPGYFGSFGYYTTCLSHMDNPVYNRFLHGLFAFGTDASIVGAYSMGYYVSDPYNDFDSGYYQLHPLTHPDFLYAYPTWSGELLSIIGGLEAIREGVKDAKYFATLQDLLPDDPCSWTSLQQEAHDYLESLKGMINPDYDIGYVKQMTDLGYYEAILDDLTDPCNPLTNDYEAFSRIRAKLVEYIIGNHRAHNLTQDTWYSTIQAGIDNAEINNVIEVQPGTYYENIDFLGKAITLRSTDPADPCVVETTIIDGGNQDNVVEFVNGEGNSSVISGFTIRNGSDYGIYCYSTSPLISNCIIEDNNEYNERGIQISGSGAAPCIYQNKIRDNTFGILAATYTEPVIKNNWIYDNAYGVRFYISGPAIFRNNTIVGNTGYGVSKTSTATPIISNCILWNNGYDLDNCSATYSCIEDYDPCTGNIHCDPCFVDAANNDYHLRDVSPCIDAGDPCFSGDPCEVDIDGDPRVLNVRVDMGADEFDRLEDPLAHWKFDETSGTTAYDTTGTYNGTLQGDPCWIDGYLDGALNFDGTDDYVSFAGTLGVGGDSFTVSAWIKAGQARSQHRGIFRFASGSGTEVNIYLCQSSGKLRIYDYTTYKDSTIALDDGSWHHITVVRNDDDDLNVYIDGQLNFDDEDYFSGTTLKSLTSVGYRDGYRYFDGYIDDPRIYDFALNADEVERLYSID